MALGRFVLKRALQGIVVVWGVVTVVFGLRFITPGSPINVIAPLDASAETKRAIAQELGLDEPLYVQYADYVVGLLQGDMGYSYISNTQASSQVFARLPATLELAVVATIVAIAISIPLGVLSATRRNEPADYGATLFSLGGISTPNFWLGIMLVLVFAVQLEVFKTSGRGPGFGGALATLLTSGSVDGLLTWLSYITLPTVTLGTYFTALVTRVIAGSVI